MEITVRPKSNVQLIQLRGALRLGESVNQLRHTLDDLTGAGDHRIVLDLQEVPMIDSSGIGLLVKFLATTRRHGGSLKLVNPSEFAIKTLRLVGVLNLFDIYTDQSEAVLSFAA